MMSINVWDDWMNRQANDQLKRRSLQDDNERALALQFSISYEKIWNKLRKWKTVQWETSDLRIRARRAAGLGRFCHRQNPEAVRNGKVFLHFAIRIADRSEPYEMSSEVVYSVC